MIRSALLLCAALLAALTFACTQQAGPLQTRAAAPALAYRFSAATACASGTTGSTFAGTVRVLPAGFRPDFYGSDYTSPSQLSNLPTVGSVNSNISTDLAAAFNIAPQSFQNFLCGLSGVFINPTDCPNNNINNCNISDDRTLGNSWGYRERPDQSANGGRYIALSAGLWPSANNSAIALNDYETRVLNQLLGLNSGGPVYTAGTPDNTSQMTVLAALAHEFGHVLWYDQIGHSDPNQFCSTGGGFFSGSWAGPVQNPPIWRTFGDPQGEHLSDGQPDNVPILTIIRALGKNSGRPDRVGGYIDGIYRNDANTTATGRWASLFASFSPDEDFVETYVLKVLMNATNGSALTSLKINIPISKSVALREDVPNTIASRPELNRKMACLP